VEDEFTKSGLLSTDELLKDPEGAALISAMQSQIAEHLEVDPAIVAVQGIHEQGNERVTRLAEYTVAKLRTAHEAAFVTLNPGSNSRMISPLPTLRQSGYYTVPSMQELAAMPTSALRHVRGFRVGRIGFGEVRWLGMTDVTRLNLDDIVSIERGDISVYHSDDVKPDVGVELNKPATLILEHISPPAGVGIDAFKKELENTLRGIGATSVDYDVLSKSWSFTVPHFSG